MIATTPETSLAQDERSLLALARGDADDREAALLGLHDLHKDSVFAFLLRILRDRSLAEDALQETFLLVYSSFDRYDPTRPFRPWLFQIARNAALGVLRLRKKDERLEQKAARSEATHDSGIGRELLSRETAERARAALARLPFETRALLIQRHLLGAKLEEIAESFSVTERTVRNRLREAALELARELLEPTRKESEA